jgi:hypothetical protein
MRLSFGKSYRKLGDSVPNARTELVVAGTRWSNEAHQPADERALSSNGDHTASSRACVDPACTLDMMLWHCHRHDSERN